MEKIDNLNQNDVLELILDFPLKPRGRNVIITSNTHEPDGSIVLSNNMFAETQYILAVGSHVHDLVAGQKVMVDIEKMLKHMPSPDNSHEQISYLELKTVEVNEKTFAIISDGYIICEDNR